MPELLTEWEGWEGSEAEQVMTHRLRQFTEAGYAYPEALELAMAAVDHHELEDLLASGCSAELAMQILL